jgi:hypothetical protein
VGFRLRPWGSVRSLGPAETTQDRGQPSRHRLGILGHSPGHTLPVLRRPAPSSAVPSTAAEQAECTRQNDTGALRTCVIALPRRGSLVRIPSAAPTKRRLTCDFPELVAERLFLQTDVRPIFRPICQSPERSTACPQPRDELMVGVSRAAALRSRSSASREAQEIHDSLRRLSEPTSTETPLLDRWRSRSSNVMREAAAAARQQSLSDQPDESV